MSIVFTKRNLIKIFIDNRIWSYGKIDEPLDDSQQLYSLYFAVKDMREEIEATIDFLKRMVAEDRHQERANDQRKLSSNGEILPLG